MALQVSCRNRRRKPCAVYSLKWQSIIFMSHQFFFFLDWTGPTIEALNLCALPYCILLCQVQIGSRSKTSLYVTSWTIFKCQPVSSYEKCSLLITYLCHGTISNKCLSPSPSEQMSKSGSVDFRQISNILCWSMMELHLMLLLVTYWYWIGRCSMDQSSSSATGFGHCLSFFPFYLRAADFWHISLFLQDRYRYVVDYCNCILTMVTRSR